MGYIACSCSQIKDKNGKAWPLPTVEDPQYAVSDCSEKWLS